MRGNNLFLPIGYHSSNETTCVYEVFYMFMRRSCVSPCFVRAPMSKNRTHTHLLDQETGKRERRAVHLACSFAGRHRTTLFKRWHGGGQKAGKHQAQDTCSEMTQHHIFTVKKYIKSRGSRDKNVVDVQDVHRCYLFPSSHHRSRLSEVSLRTCSSFWASSRKGVTCLIESIVCRFICAYTKGPQKGEG